MNVVDLIFETEPLDVVVKYAKTKQPEVQYLFAIDKKSTEEILNSLAEVAENETVIEAIIRHKNTSIKTISILLANGSEVSRETLSRLRPDVDWSMATEASKLNERMQ